MDAPDSLTGVGRLGVRLRTLEALRDRLTGAIDEAPTARDLAALTARLTDVLVQIEECEANSPDAQKGTALDEFTKRRAEREASRPPSSTKRVKRS